MAATLPPMRLRKMMASMPMPPKNRRTRAPMPSRTMRLLVDFELFFLFIGGFADLEFFFLRRRGRLRFRGEDRHDALALRAAQRLGDGILRHLQLGLTRRTRNNGRHWITLENYAP